jgi:hypothetical protein
MEVESKTCTKWISAEIAYHPRCFFIPMAKSIGVKIQLEKKPMKM